MRASARPRRAGRGRARRSAPPGDDAVIGREGVARIGEGDAQAGLRDGAIGLRRALRRIDAREQPRADEEILLAGGVAQPVEPILDARRRRADEAADAPLQRVDSRARPGRRPGR